MGVRRRPAEWVNTDEAPMRHLTSFLRMMVGALSLSALSVISACDAQRPLGFSNDPDICYRCVAWDDERRIDQWDALIWHRNPSSWAISGDASRVAGPVLGAASNELLIHDWSTGDVTILRHQIRHYKLHGAAFGPDGRLLALIAATPPYSGESRIILVDLVLREVIAQIGTGSRYYESIAFSYDGSALFALANETSEYDSATGALPEYREIQSLKLYRIDLATARHDEVSPYRTYAGWIHGSAADGSVHVFLAGVYGPEGEGVGPGQIADFCSPPHPFHLIRCQGHYLVSQDHFAPFLADDPRAVPLSLRSSTEAMFVRSALQPVIQTCNRVGSVFSDCTDEFAADIRQLPGVDVWTGHIVSGALTDGTSSSLSIVEPSGRSFEISLPSIEQRGEPVVIEAP